jgi:hypothetical protein
MSDEAVPGGVADSPARSPELGEYLEFRERSLHSAIVMAVWLIAAGLLVIAAVNAAPYHYCRWKYLCENATAESNREGAILGVIICLGIVALLLWRRLFRTPLVRIGELGFEFRVAGFTRRVVPWRDVVAIGCARRSFLFWRVVDVFLDPGRFPPGQRLLVVRVSGLDEAPHEIEAEMRICIAEFHRAEWRRRPASAWARSPEVLPVRAETGQGRPVARVTVAGLRRLLDGVGPVREYVILSRTGAENPDQEYMQTARDALGRWRLEYRDGGPDRHCGVDLHDVEEVQRAMVDWARDRDEWRTRLPWEKVEFHEPGLPG